MLRGSLFGGGSRTSSSPSATARPCGRRAYPGKPLVNGENYTSTLISPHRTRPEYAMPPSVDEEDTRKVQTAVSGSPGADSPVYLPMDVVEYDTFIRLHPQKDFYCGRLLGGCGKKLTARKYRDKKCHFAHIASGHCRRSATNEASADHLYMGRALVTWLKQQKCKGVQPRYKQKGQLLRERVDVLYTLGWQPRLLRVQLAAKSKALWEADDSRLRSEWAGIEWLFGPDSMLANWQVDRQGHALRIRCRASGATRIVEIGTQYPDTPVEWVPLSACRMTSFGIQTPGLALTPGGLVQRGKEPRSSAAPRGKADARMPTDPLIVETAQAAPTESAGRRGPGSDLLPETARDGSRDGESLSASSRRLRARTVFGDGAEAAPRPVVEQAPVLAAPQTTAVTPAQLLSRDDERAGRRLVRLLNHLDLVGDILHLDQLQSVLREAGACVSAMWSPPACDLTSRIAAWRAHANLLIARPSFREIQACADLIRPALRMAARVSRPLTWMDLGSRLDDRLPGLHPDDKVSVLVETDRMTPHSRPLLSALVAARENRVHPLYAQVLDHLDRPVPSEHAAQARWLVDVRSHRASESGDFLVTRV